MGTTIKKSLEAISTASRTRERRVLVDSKGPLAIRTEKARRILTRAGLPISNVSSEIINEGFEKSQKDVITVYTKPKKLNANMHAIVKASKTGVVIRGITEVPYY